MKPAPFRYARAGSLAEATALLAAGPGEARERAPLLAEAARHVGHAAIRNRGTLGGSVAHADPAADPGWGFIEIARRPGDFALAGVAAIVRAAPGAPPRGEQVRLVGFGVGDRPLRLTGAERLLPGLGLEPASAGRPGRPRARTAIRPTTCTAPPTIGGTSPRSSPSAPCSEALSRLARGHP